MLFQSFPPPKNHSPYPGNSTIWLLSMSCNSSLIRSIGCTINIFSWFTLLQSITDLCLLRFFMITTIRDAHGDVDGRMILADSNFLIRSATFSQNLGATGLTLCVTGFAPLTPISQTDLRAAGGRASPFPISKW